MKEIAEEVHLRDHLREIMVVVREANIQVFIVPHHRWRLEDAMKSCRSVPRLAFFEAHQERDAQGLQGRPARYVHDSQGPEVNEDLLAFIKG